MIVMFQGIYKKELLYRNEKFVIGNEGHRLMKKTIVPILSVACIFYWLVSDAFQRVTDTINTITFVYFLDLAILIIVCLFMVICKFLHKTISIFMKIILIITLIIALSPIGLLFWAIWAAIGWIALIISIAKIITAIIRRERFKYNIISAISVILFYAITIIAGMNGIDPMMYF